METKQEEKSFNATEFAQRKAKEMQEKLTQKPELEEVESSETPQDEPVEVEKPQEEEVIPEEATEMSERERQLVEETQALKRELARAKGERREQALKIELPEVSANFEEEEKGVQVTKGEVALYSGWREEALEKFLDVHPEYTSNPRLKKAFEQECKDRLPELVYAKRNNIPVTPKLFKERFDRVHRSISDQKGKAMEEGKKELLQAQSAASVMGAASGKSSAVGGTEKPKSKFLFKKSAGLQDWLVKKT